MTQILQNDKVSISYTGKLINGTIFQTASEAEPLTITIGNHDVPPTLEQALIGMAEGEHKRVQIEPDEGYGPRRKDLLQTLDAKNITAKTTPQVGMILSLKVEKDGQEHRVPATIVEITHDTVIVDYNHPLAGHTLIYDIKVLSVEHAPQ